MTDISREAIKKMVDRTCALSRSEVSETMLALRDALDEAEAREPTEAMLHTAVNKGWKVGHKAGWLECQQLAAQAAMDENERRLQLAPRLRLPAMAVEIKAAILALPYEPQEDVIDG